MSGTSECATHRPQELDSSLPTGPIARQQLLQDPCAHLRVSSAADLPEFYSQTGLSLRLDLVPPGHGLDLRLAAFLDNTAGGPTAVNGTLQSVTYQVGFLGLSSTIVNAIPNATEPSDGLWGPPTAQAPAAPSSGLFGAFWNAVTSFVTNPLGTVESLVDTVWDVTEAATVYLDHLAHEAAAIDAEVVARTAAAIVHVGQVIANALNALLNWIIEQVTKLLSPILSPLTAAMRSWGGSLWSGFQTLWSEYNSSPSGINDGLAAGLLEDLFGNLFDVLLGVSVAVAVALTIIQVIGLGADAIVDVVLELIPPPSEAVGCALSLALVPTSYFSTGMVQAGWALYNETTSVVSPFFGPLLAIFGVGIGAIRLYSTAPEAVETLEALSQGVAPSELAVYEPIVATVTGLLAIALTVVGHLVGGLEGAYLGTIGLIIAGTGALFALMVIAKYWSQLKEALQLNDQLIGVGLDGVGLATSLAEAEL